jgi:hypothetical protein
MMDLQKEKIMLTNLKNAKIYIFCVFREMKETMDCGLFYNLFSKKENFYCFGENLGAKKFYSLGTLARNKC